MKISRFLVALAIPWPTPGTKACNAAGGLDCPIFGRHRDTASRHDRQIVPMLGPTSHIWTLQRRNGRFLWSVQRKRHMTNAKKSEVLQGTLELMILKTLH